MKRTASSLGEAWQMRLMGVLEEIAAIAANDSENVDIRVHEIRKAAKHGRAVLKLAPDGLREQARRQRETLREMRRLFGPARAARVDLQLFEQFCGSRKSGRLAEAGQKIAAICAEQESKVPSMRRPMRAAGRIAKDIRDWDPGTLKSDDIIERLVKGYRKARDLLPTDESAIEHLHDFRSAVVDYRYQMRLIAGLRDKTAAQRERQAQELRESLGEYLDVERLIGRLQEFDIPADEMKQLRKGQQKRLKTALADAALLFDPKPRLVRKDLEEISAGCG